MNKAEIKTNMINSLQAAYQEYKEALHNCIYYLGEYDKKGMLHTDSKAVEHFLNEARDCKAEVKRLLEDIKNLEEEYNE